MATAQSTAQTFVGRRFSTWLDRRVPPSTQITLSQRNVFIFPTQTGFVFGGLLVLLILGAINYQASLVYGVAFMLGSMFLMTILHTFRNLSGLSLELINTRPGFVGEDVEFTVRVVRPKGAGREGVQLGWPDGIKQWAELNDQEADTVRLYVVGEQRGYLDPGRLLVETYYPLGLLRAWTWVDLNARALVYPKPIFQDFPMMEQGSRDDGELIDPQGSDDFTDIRDYQPGDPIKHIFWRSYARSGELMVKRYASFVEPRLWLDMDTVPGALEERLSRLTGLALQATRREREFGLRLGELLVKPAVGEAHLENVLRGLALYAIPTR
ncbi:MAG: DUF58 domain-containing protein [Gammaproteobacteria bacterium]|nr:DUF58 domain-containing protein [Gammaproteobacteria bacterium]